MFRFIITALFCIWSVTAAAQDTTRAILVLDGSGSMWGQIDGKAKITIAQEVVSELLQSFPAEQELGLTVYGHRRKGDCSDIETIVLPNGDQRAAISKAVNGIKPKGKTPLSAAVIEAANALRYSEEAATVILVTDGIETCNMDPCAVGNALEEVGVNFTAHVIGFDISDPAGRAELQCLAEVTGGTFRTASNAAELSDALLVVAKPEPVPEPEPEPVEVSIYATDGRHGPRIGDELVWDLASGDSAILQSQITPSLKQRLNKGEYLVSVLRPVDEAFAEARFGVGSVNKTVVLELPEYRPGATVEGPTTAVAGSTVQIRWTGPDANNDYISVAEPDSDGNSYIEYTYTREGPLLELIMPPKEGLYELNYVLNDGRKVIAKQAVEVTPVAASIAPPDTLLAGATVNIDWTGPDYQNDFISVAKTGEEAYINYTYTREGSPLGLQMPGAPGQYDIIYTMNQKRRVIARVAVEVTGIQFDLSAPASAVAGSTVQVTWSGPDYQNDFISVAETGSKDGKYRGYTYTREGSPLDLVLPLETGKYEIRYILNQDREVAAMIEINLTAVSATLEAPDAADVGSRIDVSWDGPDYRNDYISISGSESDELKYDRYTYTRKGSPLELELPSLPGKYVVRYIASGNPKSVLAEQTITLKEVIAEMSADPIAQAGGTLEVIWSGPANHNDFIGLGKVGENYKTYTYVKNGSPLEVKIPQEPGQYELRYYMNSDKRVIGMIPVSVE